MFFIWNTLLNQLVILIIWRWSDISFIERKLKGFPREVLSTLEIAEVVGVDPATIRRHIRSDKLKAVKVGGVYHIKLHEVACYLKKHWIY